MVPSIREAGEPKAPLGKFRLTGPVGVLVTLATMVFFLVVEPHLAWFILSALVAGVAVALVLRSSRCSSTNDKDQERPEIQMAKIPVNGPMGLVFTLGTMAIFLLALPEIRWFLLLALPVGTLVGLSLHLWHSRHP
jgi:cytosine/uracil/thiamine/allantoin permease